MHDLLVSLTRLLNHLFGAPLVAILHSLGIHPARPNAPINDALTLELVIAAAMVIFFIVTRLSLNAEKPGTAQNLAEVVHEFVSDQADATIGHGYEKFVPYATMIGVFVLSCNLMGLLPGIETPTSNPVVPLGLAIPTWLYFNWQGLREHGAIGYAKTFLGPMWWIAWLVGPIEIISNLARVMSLTIRLYANMFASDLLTLVFFSMIPVALPVVFLGLHLFVSLIQAYVFMLLTLIYLSLAIAHEH
ncbi:MAG: F0F1 ATP synthase subunit A [Silvibacterium sp.]|nr:F0F1 ATP synthase subunit A [Silvibacterium sp.]MBV8436121.1 F0F1 ATP synthase subunit A [Silvibacterium sp.]